MKIVCIILGVILALSLAAYAQEGVTPPMPLESDFAPKTIDTTLGDQTVVFSFSVADDLSGVVYVDTVIGSVASPTSRFGCGSTPTSDPYQCNITLPQFSPLGEWEVLAVFTKDAVGNEMRLETAVAEDTRCYIGRFRLDPQAMFW